MTITISADTPRMTRPGIVFVRKPGKKPLRTGTRLRERRNTSSPSASFSCCCRGAGRCDLVRGAGGAAGRRNSSAASSSASAVPFLYVSVFATPEPGRESRLPNYNVSSSVDSHEIPAGISEGNPERKQCEEGAAIAGKTSCRYVRYDNVIKQVLPRTGILKTT